MRIIKVIFSVFILALVFSESSRSWFRGKTSPFIVNCPTYDTTAFQNGGAVVLSSCISNTGFYGTMFVTAIGEVSCGPTNSASLSLIAGLGITPPYGSYGANFNGQISGGVLTVNSMVTPPLFNVATGQTLFDSQSGAGIPTNASGSTLKITGLISGTGGIGTYSVSDNSVTVSNELIWALNVSAPLDPPPAFGPITRSIQEDFNCQNGTTSIVTMTGNIDANAFNRPNLNIWIGLQLFAENASPQIASWKNGQITIFAPGGLAQ